MTKIRYEIGGLGGEDGWFSDGYPELVAPIQLRSRMYVDDILVAEVVTKPGVALIDHPVIQAILATLNEEDYVDG